MPELFWTTDEDGERVHRLQSEWDGNKGAWWSWNNYRSEADRSEIAVGALWAQWGVGVETDWYRFTAWIDGRRVPYRHQSLTVSFGPWYLAITRVRPVADNGDLPAPGGSS
jgi:hypothetical protein